MRPRRAFRPAGDALEARWVPSFAGVHHAAIAHLHHPAHVHHHLANRTGTLTGGLGGGLVGASVGNNLFPFAAGTLFGALAAGGNRAGVLTFLPASGAGGFGTFGPGPLGLTGGQILFGQLGPNYALLSSIPPSTVAASDFAASLQGPGGDLNGLVLYGGPGFTPGGTLNGLVF